MTTQQTNTVDNAVPHTYYNPSTVYGPKTKLGEELHSGKYRGKNETFYDAMSRISGALADNEEHRKRFKGILLNQRFLPGGRIQSSMGSTRATASHNCNVSGTIEDNMGSIMERAAEAAETMRMGAGIGYDFSKLRPRGDRIVTLDSASSGPVSFMGIYDAICATISSSGHRRGAQMGVLRIDHPDIEEFIRAKQNERVLTNFNISVGITDEFMRCVQEDSEFDLRFEGKTYKTVSATALWDEIMRSTWDWAEPGVLFIDTINKMNNLNYCETIAATNPCAEQPLPPYGACLLGSFNLTQYLVNEDGEYFFNWPQFLDDIPDVVRAMDNVIDKAKYPLPEQELEAKSKRRIGLGVTGLANAVEAMGLEYGSKEFIVMTKGIMNTLRNEAYKVSAMLAEEKGAFPLFNPDTYLASEFIRELPFETQDLIYDYGIRNSHLISIAPAGTISLTADNVSSGIEPVFSYGYNRTIITETGQPVIEKVVDYGVAELGVKGRCADDVPVKDHLAVLLAVQPYVDSAVSKTCNVGDDVMWKDFKQIYMDAWLGGAKGCTTFRASGKRYGVLNKGTAEEDSEGTACYIDPETGNKECS